MVYLSTSNISAFMNLEYIPQCLLTGIIRPVYKGKGEDPLKCDSYRGFTMTGVIMKVHLSIAWLSASSQLS